jgi:hypothetical protein
MPMISRSTSVIFGKLLILNRERFCNSCSILSNVKFVRWYYRRLSAELVFRGDMAARPAQRLLSNRQDARDECPEIRGQSMTANREVGRAGGRGLGESPIPNDSFR